MSFEHFVTQYGAEFIFFAAVLLAIGLLRLIAWSGGQAATAGESRGTFVSPWQRSKRPVLGRKTAKLRALPDPQARVETSASTASASTCRWRMDSFRPRDAEFNRWVCLDCDAEGYSRDATPPVICKRGLKPRAI